MNISVKQAAFMAIITGVFTFILLGTMIVRSGSIVSLPPLAEQERIIAILDKFDALVNGTTPSPDGATPPREGNIPALTATPPEEGNKT